MDKILNSANCRIVHHLQASRNNACANDRRNGITGHGEIVERGTHADLLARDGRYASLWRRQQAEADAA